MNTGVRRSSLFCTLVLMVCGCMSGALTAVAATVDHPTVEELLRRTDDLFRGTSSRGTMTMRIKSARWERELTMRVQSEGTDKTLIQMLVTLFVLPVMEMPC